MQKFQIRSSGFQLYLLGIIEILSISGVIFCFVEIIINFNFAFIIGVLFYSWLSYVLYIYTFSNQITVDDYKLILRGWKNPKRKSYLDRFKIPRVIETEVNLGDIDFIFLGRKSYFGKVMDGRFEGQLKESIRKKQYVSVSLEENLLYKNILEKYTPMVTIITKDKKQIMINTKPYSKRNFIKLFDVFCKVGIETVIQEGILK